MVEAHVLWLFVGLVLKLDLFYAGQRVWVLRDIGEVCV
jgi:hypothetical protein